MEVESGTRSVASVPSRCSVRLNIDSERKQADCCKIQFAGAFSCQCPVKAGLNALTQKLTKRYRGESTYGGFRIKISSLHLGTTFCAQDIVQSEQAVAPGRLREV